MVLWAVSFLISASAVGYAAVSSTVMFSKACSGPFEFFPAHPFGFALDVPAIDRGVTAFYAKAKARAQCQCSSLTEEGFDILFDPFAGALNAASGGGHDVGCDGYFPRNITAFSQIFTGSLPSTCTYDTWKSVGTCAFKVEMPFPNPAFTFKLDVALSKCAKSRFPSFVVECEECDKFMMPCTEDSDCAGTAGTCATNMVDRNTIATMLFQAFSSGGSVAVNGVTAGLFWAPTDTMPGCMQRYDSFTTSNDLITSILTWVKEEVYGVSGQVSETNFCGLDALVSDNTTDYYSGTAYHRRSEGQVEATVNAAQGDTADIHPRGHGSDADGSQNRGSACSGGGYHQFYTRGAGSEPLECLPLGGIDLSNISSWTQGAAAIQALPVLPAPDLTQTDSSAFRIFELSCDGQLLMFDGAIRARAGRKFIDLVDKVTGLLRQIEECRAGRSLSTEQFLTRFGVWTLYPWLWALDGNPIVDTFDLGPAMSDFMSSFFDRSGSYVAGNDADHDRRIRANIFQNFPSTCTFKSHFTDHQCRVLYKGLQSLLSMDVNFLFQASACSAHKHLESFTMDCVGTDCATFKLPTPCSSTGDCPSHTKCFDFKRDGPWEWDTDGFWDTLFPKPTGGATNASICNDDNTGFVSDTSCGGGLLNEQNFAYSIFRATGVAEDKAASALVKFCIPENIFADNENIFTSSVLDSWVQSQVSVDANGGVALSSLSAYGQPEQTSMGATVDPSELVLGLPFFIAIPVLQSLL